MGATERDFVSPQLGRAHKVVASVTYGTDLGRANHPDGAGANDADVVALHRAEVGFEGEHSLGLAWFAGWAPAEDPRVVVVVQLEGEGSGGERAAPVAKEVFTALVMP